MIKKLLLSLICLAFLPSSLSAATVLPKPKNITVAEGLSSESDAKNKCPRTCSDQSGQWTNSWNATSCSCYRVVAKTAKRPIKSNEDSIQVCGETCKNNWKLKWETTGYLETRKSVCYCIIPWDLP